MVVSHQGFPLRAGDRVGNGPNQRVLFDGLRHVCLEAPPQAFVPVLLRGVGGDRDGGGEGTPRRVMLSDAAQQLHAAHPGHRQVTDQHVTGLSPPGGQRVDRLREREDLRAGTRQRGGDDGNRVVVVVNRKTLSPSSLGTRPPTPRYSARPCRPCA